MALQSALAASLLAVGTTRLTDADPLTWVVASVACWSTFALCSPKETLRANWLHVLWAYLSAAAFFCYLRTDPSFQSWAGVYYFCSDPRYCSCGFRWTMLGYLKFAVLWNFVLSAALGIQKLVIAFLFDGLLPGEEVVTKESFVSICWRLIPYWLNNWEQDWGAECSSVLFELPHFAVELLVVLPTVQILCSRLRILALPQLRVVVPAGEAENEEIPREDLAADIMRGHWHLDRNQRTLAARLRANKRVMLVTAGVALLAAANAIVVPISMEASVLAHPRSRLLLAMPRGVGPLTEPLQQLQDEYLARDCPAVGLINSVMRKHALELRKMGDPERRTLIPVIEAALAVMRLSCEKFFVLASVFAAYLLFREPPMSVRYVIQLNARLSQAFQKVILYTFPAICWVYGAGFAFSAFVSVVFWGGPAMRLLETLRLHSATVRPASLEPATAADIERMGGHCAICWGDMDMQVPQDAAAGGPGAEQAAQPPAAAVRLGMALPCRHAFHESCIVQWLHQCHGQGRSPTCPMCAATVELRVQWRNPLRLRGSQQPELPPDDADADEEPVPAAPEGLFPEIQAMIEEMDDIGDVNAEQIPVAAPPRAPQPAAQPPAPPFDNHAAAPHLQDVVQPPAPHREGRQPLHHALQPPWQQRAAPSGSIGAAAAARISGIRAAMTAEERSAHDAQAYSMHLRSGAAGSSSGVTAPQNAELRMHNGSEVSSGPEVRVTRSRSLLLGGRQDEATSPAADGDSSGGSGAPFGASGRWLAARAAERRIAAASPELSQGACPLSQQQQQQQHSASGEEPGQRRRTLRERLPGRWSNRAAHASTSEPSI